MFLNKLERDLELIELGLRDWFKTKNEDIIYRTIEDLVDTRSEMVGEIKKARRK